MKRNACRLEPVQERSAPAEPGATVARRVETYFAELRAPVYAYAVSVVYRPDIAEDLTQETFLRLYMHLAAGGDFDNVKAWAFRVCHNLAINYMKKHPRDAAGEGAVHGPLSANDVWENIAALEPDPETRLLEQERNRMFASRVRRLTERQMRCLYLRAEGLRYREIADQLDITISTVVDTLTRAVERLRKAHDGEP